MNQLLPKGARLEIELCMRETDKGRWPKEEVQLLITTIAMNVGQSLIPTNLASCEG